VRPQIREWFTDAGFREIAFDSEPTGNGVGVNQSTRDTHGTLIPDRLFSFVR